MLEKLKELMKNVDPDMNLDNVNENTKLIDDLHFDSLGIMMFAMAIEDEYGISFDEPMNFLTVCACISNASLQSSFASWFSLTSRPSL